ncbi:type 1 glutamine amidotransferase domain-containing protein [Streptococcus halichoeri]|uniref:type 1 glutamine amidotransferase domain-containing protein n=1 Tax=Streptococcus halichoeri TaxID=254785 RepID=UPI0013591941|nr:type 1 glutamine amidotransferase domain-containing protein [Streptococcus halichoeri]
MTKVLMVVTNVGTYGDADRLTGLWLSELTHAYDVFSKAGYTIDVVSPKGGYVPLDPNSLADMDDVSLAYYRNADFQNRILGASLSPNQVTASDYDIIYYTGGHGTMWDFPHSESLATIASQIYDQGGIVSAVCHGVVGLLPIKDAAEKNLIADKEVTGFSNEEETKNGTQDMVPFLAESALREGGAKVRVGKPFTSTVASDHRVFTGQNPQSAKALAQAIVDYLAKA